MEFTDSLSEEDIVMCDVERPMDVDDKGQVGVRRNYEPYDKVHSRSMESPTVNSMAEAWHTQYPKGFALPGLSSFTHS